MSLKVTLLLCLIAHLVHCVPYIKYGRFPARGAVTVNAGLSIGGLNGGLSTLGQALGQTANNRLTVANRPAGSVIGYTTLGSILGSTAFRPGIQTSGNAAQNCNAQASVQASTTTADRGNPNGMQGSWPQGIVAGQSPWQNGAAGGIAGQIGAQMGSQNGAISLNSANSDQASWTAARPSSTGSQNWQNGISASTAGQWMPDSNFNSQPSQPGGGIFSGMGQNFNEQGLQAPGSMQAGMNIGQVANQYTGASSAGVGIGTSGRENWVLPTRPSASNLQINDNGLLTTSMNTGISVNAQATIGSTSSTGGSNQPSWADVPRPSSAVSHTSNWQGGISASIGGQSGASTSPPEQSGGGSSMGQSFQSSRRPGNAQGATSNGGIDSNSQENWNMQNPTQSTSRPTQVLPARPSVGNVQINANGQLTSENTGIAVDAQATLGTSSHQTSQSLHSHDNGQNDSDQRGQSGQTQHEDSIAADWWGLGQIDDYPERRHT